MTELTTQPPATVLLVEDNTAIRTLQRFVLIRAGVRVVECADLSAAEAALEAHAPDVVVLDLNLPDGHGLTLLSHVDRTRTAVLIMTGMSQPHIIDESAGISDSFMNKPFEPDAFVRRVMGLARQGQTPAPVLRDTRPTPGRPRPWRDVRGHRLLLNFGLLSLGVSFVLTLLIISTGVTLLMDHLRPGTVNIWPTLIFTCIIAGLSCAVLSVLQFAQRTVQERGILDAEAHAVMWNEALLAWAYQGVPLSQDLDLTGAQTLLKLRDTLRGESSDQLARLYAEQGWLNRDLQFLRHPRTSVVLRAEIIERLALLREAHALDALERELRHRHPEIRALALLALARSVGRLGLHRSERISRVLALHGAITQGQFSTGQVQEALTLLGDAGTVLAKELLSGTSDRLRAAVLDVLARQRSRHLRGEVTTLLSHPNAELRAGALRVLANSGPVPQRAADTILALTQDPIPFVRLQATKAAVNLTPLPTAQLWALLGDSHWWVRRAAAQGLLRAPGGKTILIQAAERHVDRYACDAARSVLQEEEEKAMTSLSPALHRTAQLSFTNDLPVPPVGA